MASDIDKILGPKSFEQLEALEKQIQAKLRSDEPIDTDYWEQLLRSLRILEGQGRYSGTYTKPSSRAVWKCSSRRTPRGSRRWNDYSRPLPLLLGLLLLGPPGLGLLVLLLLYYF